MSQQTDRSTPPPLLDEPEAARPPRRGADVAAIYGLLAIAALIEFWLRDLLTKPFFSDEAWRAYDITLGLRFFSHLNESAAPLALGWLGIEDAARLLLGNTEAGLRAPMFVALPVLGIATYLLARRWLGPTVSFCVAALLLVNPWVVNNALQLKSYSYEGILSVATVALVLLVRRTTWRPVQLLLLYLALGLTAVFSLPNLFILGPLLLLDLVHAIRSRDRTRLRIAGEILAGLIALVHYALFLRPQAGVAATIFWQRWYAPRHPGPFVHFVVHQLASFDPLIVTGVVSAENNSPTYSLPPVGHYLLAAGILVLLAAGLWAAVRDAAARTIVVALGGALVLELIASVLKRWPFGMARVNVFMLPLFYILAAIGAVWLARAALGPLARRSRSDGPDRFAAPDQPAGLDQPAGFDQPAAPDRLARWRLPLFWALAALLAMTVLPGGIATAHALAESAQVQDQVTQFSNVKAAVERTRRQARPGDLVIVRTSRHPTSWYDEGWLYYMDSYQGWPASIAKLPVIPASDTASVLDLTPGEISAFLAAHRGSQTIFLLELQLPDGIPKSLHRQSLRTLRRFGYCPVHKGVFYPQLGDLTVVHKGACHST